MKLATRVGLAAVANRSAEAVPQHVTYAARHDPAEPHVATRARQRRTTLYDAWKTRYVVQMGTEPDGHPRYRIRAGRNASDPTVSGGTGIRLRCSPRYFAGHDPNARTLFDGLWEFALDHASTIDAALDGLVRAGERRTGRQRRRQRLRRRLRRGLRLLLAERQWGNGGRFDYAAEATRVLAGVLQSTDGPQSQLADARRLGRPQRNAYDQRTTRTRTSCSTTSAPSSVGAADATWGKVASATTRPSAAIVRHYSLATRCCSRLRRADLASNLAPKPAPPNFLEARATASTRTTPAACRGASAPTRSSTASDRAAPRAAARRFGSRARPRRIRSDPRRLQARRNAALGSNYFTTVFAAPFAVAAMTRPAEQSFLDDAYEAVKASDEDYYEDTVTLLCMVVLTGNWWDPTLP
jgi:hypothetical protein